MLLLTVIIRQSIMDHSLTGSSPLVTALLTQHTVLYEPVTADPHLHGGSTSRWKIAKRFVPMESESELLHLKVNARTVCTWLT